MEARAHHWADEILDICDDGSNDWIERQNKDGSTYETVNSEVINRSRLRVDTRKWLLSKLMPKKYGDKIIHAGDQENPLQVVQKIEREIVRSNKE